MLLFPPVPIIYCSLMVSWLLTLFSSHWPLYSISVPSVVSLSSPLCIHARLPWPSLASFSLLGENTLLLKFSSLLAPYLPSFWRKTQSHAEWAQFIWALISNIPIMLPENHTGFHQYSLFNSPWWLFHTYHTSNLSSPILTLSGRACIPPHWEAEVIRRECPWTLAITSTRL